MNELFDTVATPPVTSHEIVLTPERRQRPPDSFAWIPTRPLRRFGRASTRLKAAKVATPLAAPANYFDLTFNADSGVAYRVWMRAKADGNSYANDSVYLQFDQSVTPPAHQPIEWHNQRGNAGARGLFRLRHLGMGLGRRRLWPRGPRTADLLRQVRPTDTSGAGARGRHRHRSNRPLRTKSTLTNAPGAVPGDSTILTKTQ